MRLLRTRRALYLLLRAIPILIVLLLAGIVAFSLSSPAIKLLFRPTPEAARHPGKAAGVANYGRDEVDTFYTYPEWYIVWSYQSKADFQQKSLPSGYPYFGDIGQFWQAYSRMYAATRNVYPFATGDHIVLVVIGSSFAVEYTLKGLYEKTIGRFSEWTSGNQMVAEDKYAAQVAANYAAFVHMRPFYEFHFRHALYGLWRYTPFRATHLLRTVERRIWLSLDYAVESVYCELIELATHATYGFEDVNTAAWIEFPAEAKQGVLGRIYSDHLAKDLGPTAAIVEIPRYQTFTTDARTLMEAGAHFRQIAGNELIVLSGVVPSGWTNPAPNLQLLLSQPVLSDRTKTRVVLLTRVPDLHETVPLLESHGMAIEHLYDY